MYVLTALIVGFVYGVLVIWRCASLFFSFKYNLDVHPARCLSQLQLQQINRIPTTTTVIDIVAFISATISAIHYIPVTRRRVGLFNLRLYPKASTGFTSKPQLFL